MTAHNSNWVHEKWKDALSSVFFAFEAGCISLLEFSRENTARFLSRLGVWRSNAEQGVREQYADVINMALNRYTEHSIVVCMCHKASRFAASEVRIGFCLSQYYGSGRRED